MTYEHENLKGIVETYFHYLNQLYDNQPGAVEHLLELWNDDGIFEFRGSYPVTATFQGKNAIHALYKLRTQARGMPLKLEGGGNQARSAALALVDRRVEHVKVLDENRVTAWTMAYIGTDDGRGFQSAGNNTFTVKDGKIAKIQITIAPKPEPTKDLRLEGLSVDDIGRLALAAWAVV